MISKSTIKRFWSKIRKSKSCWTYKEYKDKDGYGFFAVRGGFIRAHRFSWMIKNGNIPDGMLICHHCDNPSCVRIDHLFLGTGSDNLKDAVSKGRIPLVKLVGEDNFSSKFKEKDVRKIRKLAAKGIKHTVIARSFKRGFTTVNGIISRKTWKHVV